jgi:hypothetical protein
MKPYTKITLWYLGFGIAWIFFSDRILEHITTSVEYLSFLQTAKGWFYIFISGLLIFILTKRSYQQVLIKEEEKRSIFRGTVRGAYHILLNYLNQMQLLTLEAERSSDFDHKLLDLSKAISEETKEALQKLDNIDNITKEEIETAIYGKDSKCPSELD